MRGKAADRRRCPDTAQDHPRLCGEKSTPSTGQNALPGSPPPMRGKDRAALGKVDHNRITPAYAGKSIGTHSAATTTQDHPRLCGEKC